MKKFSLFFSLLIYLSTKWISAASPDESARFKLLQQLNRLELNDTARLSIYLKLTHHSTDAQLKSYYSNKLLAEAKRLNNAHYQCEAYLRQMSAAYNQYNVEEVNRLMQLLEPIALKNKLHNFWFLGRRCVVDMMVVNGEYERELKEANKMLQDAQELDCKVGIAVSYQSISVVYRMTYRIEEAIKMLEKAHQIAFTADAAIALEINHALIASHEGLNSYKEWFKWIQTMDNHLQELEKSNPQDWISWKMMTAIAYINYYTSIEEYANAKRYIDQAEAYNMDGYSTYSYYHHRARYYYFNNAGPDEQALKETDILADIYKELSPLTYSTIRFLKARLLKKMGRYDEAISTYSQGFHISDSINISLLNKQSEQLKKDYDAERILLEKAAINQKIQMSYLAVIFLLTVIFIVFAMHAFKVRKGLRRSENEMRKMAEEMEQANEAKENFLNTISTAINAPLTAVVQGSLQLANDEVTNPSERRAISNTINTTSAELMRLINSILELSRLEAGMMKYRITQIEAIPFIEQTIAEAIASGQRIHTNFLSVSKAEIKIEVDSGRLVEVFKRLFVASVGKEVQVSIKIDESKKDLFITIADSVLGSYKEQIRDIAMANEINRLTIEHLGGYYEVDTSSSLIRITLPST